MVTACPKCGYTNNGIDVKCANCYAPLPEKDDRPPKRRRRFSLPIQSVTLGIVALSAILYIAFGGGNWKAKDPDVSPKDCKPEPGWEKKDDSGLAYIMMCDFVRSISRSPGMAAFPDIGSPEVTVARLYGTSYQISGYIESDNDAGVYTKTRFSGEIREVIPGTWKQVSFSIDDPSVLLPKPGTHDLTSSD